MTTATVTAVIRPDSDYCALATKVREANLLAKRPGYYFFKIGLTVLAFAGGWALFALVGNSWATLGVAVVLGVLATQVVFVGHDAGHQQIYGSRRANRMVGLVIGDLLSGMSFGWWVPKHNAHHAYPNQVGRDPDIGTGVVAFSFTPEGAAGNAGTTRALARLQAWLFFPMLLVEGFGLHVTSVQAVMRRRDRSATTEAVLLGLHAAVYLTAVFWVLSPVKAVVFILLQQSVFGLYLGCTFAPNHKGMPLVEHDAKIEFTRRQVITARNVAGGRMTTLLLGGLNYQIEHHLFPTMPRPNLVKVQPMVRAFCAERGLPYQEDSLAGSYSQALHHLRTVGGGTEIVAPIAR